MKHVLRVGMLLLFGCTSATHAIEAKKLHESLGTVWESFWQQNGYPRPVYKWAGPIRVGFLGSSLSFDRDFALRQLQQVADIAGIAITEAGAGDTTANLEIEFVFAFPQPGMRCVTFVTAPGGVIQHVKIKAYQREARQCLLHESMHAMGIPGHPKENSVLSYFRYGNKLSETDELLLRTLYSKDVKPNQYVFPALAVFARGLVQQQASVEEREQTAKAVKTFFNDIARQMELFVAGTGDPPPVVLQNSKSTPEGLRRGRVEMSFLLGLAYTFGHAVDNDAGKGLALLQRAASYAHPDAQYFTAEAYNLGRGTGRDAVEAYKWYSLAAQKGSNRAKKKLPDAEKKLSAEQLQEAATRAAAWKPAVDLAIAAEETSSN